jgi:hypothetical protein
MFKKVETPEVSQEVEEVEVLCSADKYASYTNLDTVNILWEYIEVGDIYFENGLAKEVSSGAVLVAMGTQYVEGAYYTVTFNNAYELYVKNIDVKAPEHTDSNNCYTVADNSVVELWVNNDFKYLWAGISKHTEFGNVVSIR